MEKRIVLFFAFIFLLIPMVQAADSVCGRTSVPLFSNEKYDKKNFHVNQGRIIETTLTDDKKNATVRILDYRHNLIRELKEKIPAESANDMKLRIKDDGSAYYYRSGAKVIYVDANTNKKMEVPVPVNSISLPMFYPAETTLLFSPGTAETKSIFFDPNTNRSHEVEGQKYLVHGTIVASYENSGADKNKFNRMSFFDFKTGKSNKIDVPDFAMAGMIDEDHIILYPPISAAATAQGGMGMGIGMGVAFGGMGNQTISFPLHLVKINGKWEQFQDTKERLFAGKLKSGELLFTKPSSTPKEPAPAFSPINASFDKNITEVIAADGKTPITTFPGTVYPSNGYFQIINHQKLAEVYSEKSFHELLAGKPVKPLLGPAEAAMMGAKGLYGLETFSNPQETKITVMKTGKVIKLPGHVFEMNRSPEGKRVLFFGNNAASVVDLESGEIRNFKNDYFSLDPDLKDWLHYDQSSSTYQLPANICWKGNVKVATVPTDCKSASQANDPHTLQKSVAAIDEAMLAALCKEEHFDAMAWDKLAPAKHEGELSEAEAKLYLKRFQKNGGYDHLKYQGVLLAILKSELITHEPAAVLEMLKSFSVQKPELVSILYEKFSLAERIGTGVKFTSASTCRSKTEEAAVEQKFQNFLLTAATSSDKFTTVNNWEMYRPFLANMQSLKPEERDAVVDNIAESLSQAAGDSSDLRGLFQSKLYYFSKKYALDLVGDSFKPAVDLALATRDGSKVPVVLSSSIISSKKENMVFEDSDLAAEDRFGFHYQIMDPIKVDKDAAVGSTEQKKFSWEAGGRQYTADAEIKVLGPLADLVPVTTKPDYAALKKNGVSTGMMMIGSNLTSHGTLIDEYLTYYLNEGFAFEKPATVDTISFFKGIVKSGELNYLIKEAHSDGDDANLFRAIKNGLLYKGSLTKKNGEKEVIYLLGADPNKKDDGKLVSNHEFGEWIRERAEGSPLFYFNASCNSTRKVIAEIAAAQSKNFVPVATNSLAYTFSANGDSSARLMLQAYREGKTYEEIRKAMATSKYYKAGNDQYLFPDDPLYTKEVRDNLVVNADVQVTIRGTDGKPINMDEQVDH